MNRITLIIASFLIAISANAQLVVNDNVTDSVLANTMVGAGVTISNVSLNCNNGAYGLFNSTNSNVGISDGILLTTGLAAPVTSCMYNLNLSDANFDQWDCGAVNVYIDGVLSGTYTITPANWGWFSTSIFVPVGSTLDLEYVTTGGAGCDEADHELSLTDPMGINVLDYNNFGGTPPPIPAGIIFSTVANCVPSAQPFIPVSAVGPNDDMLASYVWNTVMADPDLMLLDTNATNDVCMLEFDFVPLGNQVDFQYVFASEEYPDYVCSINDVFGFFISGPGIVGSPNIALLPGTATPVGINTVNGGVGAGTNCPPGGLTNTQYYISNGNGNDCWNAPPPAHCTDTTLIRYNGLTVPLTASSPVIPCQTYHLKMAIADGTDWSFDSGVFLAANSLSSNQVFLESNYSTTSGDSVIYEGCGQATLMFTRTDTAGSTTVNFSLGGSATNGADYPFTADSVVFVPGQDTLYLTIPANTDATAEPLESITIQLIQTICAIVDTTEITFYISDLTPIVPISNDVSINCGTDSVLIGVGHTGPVDSVIWNTGGIGDSIWVSPLVTTSYYVTLTDTCGGIPVMDTVTVTVLPGAPITIDYVHDSSVTCGSAAVPVWVEYSGPVDSVLWSTGAMTDTIWVNPLVTTTYYVSINDSCGALIANDSCVVTVLPGAPISIDYTHDSSIVCGAGPVPVWVQYSGPVDSVVWNNGAMTDTIWVNPLVTTTYYVTINDSCGQFVANDSSIVTIVPPTPITLTMSNDTSKYCPQDSIWISVTASGGGGGFTYNWTPGGLTDSTIYVSPGTTTTYIVDVLDGCGSAAQDSVVFTVPVYVPLTNNILTNDTVICPGEIVTLNATITGGVGSYLSWNNGIGNVVPTNVNTAVTTNYILTAQDSCGAIVLDSVLVTVNNATLQVNTPDYTMSCLNETVTLTPVIVGGNGSETYLWSTAETSQSIQVSPIITTEYTLIITDGCFTYNDTAEVIVPVFLPLSLTVNNGLGDISVNCPGDGVVLNASYVGGAQAGLTMTWNDGSTNFTGNNITVNPTVTTTYSVSINDTCAVDSATASFTVTVPVYAPLQLTVSNDTVVCVGDPLTLYSIVTGGEGNYSYSWSGGGSDSSISITANFNANYNVTVTDGCGSSLSNSVAVTVTQPVANFSYEYVAAFGVQFTDESYDDIVMYSWLFDQMGSSSDQDPLYIFDVDGQHEVTLTVTDQNGCTAQITKTVSPPIFIYGPNSFTPDGDGNNDIFAFKGMGIEQYELMVFNRWGELLYATSNLSEGWDGTYKGKMVPNGAYVYKVRAVSFEKETFEKIGSISVLR